MSGFRQKKLTFFEAFKAGSADPDPLELQVLDRRLVRRAPAAHHTTTTSTMVPANCQLELHIAALGQVLSEEKSK